MRRLMTLALLSVWAASGARAFDQTVVLTNEVLDLYVYAPICGYVVDKQKLDIYLLGTPMFWGEPPSPDEIKDVRLREIELIGDDAAAKDRRCRSVRDNFGPEGQRIRGVAR